MVDDQESLGFDKDRLAVALKYERNLSPAPVLAAKGKGAMAEQIIALAKLHNIEIREDADLVRLLSALEVDSPIPLEAYQAVAEILAYVYRSNQRLKGSV